MNNIIAKFLNSPQEFLAIRDVYKGQKQEKGEIADLFALDIAPETCRLTRTDRHSVLSISFEPLEAEVGAANTRVVLNAQDLKHIKGRALVSVVVRKSENKGSVVDFFQGGISWRGEEEPKTFPDNSTWEHLLAKEPSLVHADFDYGLVGAFQTVYEKYLRSDGDARWIRLLPNGPNGPATLDFHDKKIIAAIMPVRTVS